MFRHLRVAALLSAILGLAACAQMCAPDQVGLGVAQLTVRNLGNVMSLVNSDTSCGFAATAVAGAPTIEGEVGSAGTVTWSVTDCEIDLGSSIEISEDCLGVKTTGSGKVTISATKTVAGVLTGVPEVPVVPGGPDAATFTFSKIAFDGFAVSKSNSDNTLTWIEGSLSATVKPRLAVDAAQGACSIATPNLTFTGIKYAESTVGLETPDLTEDIPITTSDYDAQNGVSGDKENSIEGSITVWDSAQTLPIAGNDEGLDPEYDAAKFIEGFDCDPALVTPVSYVCADLGPLLADGAARLTVKSFATAASLASADTNCGFSSAAVGGAPTISGNLGDVGSATFTVTDCTITLPADTVVSTDCNGTDTIVGGSVTVSGTKTVAGRITGDPATPIIPTSDAPAEVALTVSFSDFKVGSSADVNALLSKSGTISGSLVPRTALSEQGACEIQSSIARISDLTYTDAVLAVTSASGTFDISVATSDIDAVNGTWGADSNLLSGSISVDGDSYTVPGDGAGLDPSFDQASHDSGWQCAPGLITPVSYECGFVAPLTQGVARLTAQFFGAVGSLASADTTCGFSSMAVAGTPALSAAIGDQGDATFTMTDCTLTLPADTVIGTDCNGTETIAGGSVTVSGTKTVAGWLTGDPTAPVVPTSDMPAVVDLTITLGGMRISSSASTNALTGVTGSLSGQLIPRTALSTQGVCEIQSSVARMENLHYAAADVVLESDGRTYNLTLDSSDFDAVNGTWGADSNSLSGSITVDSQPYPVPIDGQGLNPDFDQTIFDNGWQCAPGLITPVVHTACSGNTPLAQGAGRALIQLVGLATSMLDGNDSCGFSALPVLGTGVQTGNPGETGTMTWSTAATPCAMHIPVDTVVSQDCSGTARHVMGTVTATTDKVVAGLLTGDPTQPVVPLTRDAATLTHSSLVFDGFEVYALAAGQTDPDMRATFTGTVTGTVGVIAGESISATAVSPTGGPVYSISTPVAEFTDIMGASGTLTLFTGGKTFNLSVADIDLDAFMGTYFDGSATSSNSIAGSVTVEGEAVTLPDPRLDDGFDQAAFDASYTCHPDLAGPVPFE